jgi:branched-chain amino acid transport system substrate-binding protein
MRRIKALLLMTFLVASVSCNNPSNNEAINVGVVAPLTGDGATYGASMKRGYDLAFQGDGNIHLLYEDDKLDPKEGVTALNKLISTNNTKVVMGSAASGVTMAIAPIAERNKVILFSTISSTDNLKSAGDYIFRNVPRNEIQGKAAAEFLFNNLKITSVGVFGENDEYGTNLSKSFKTRFEELGGKVVFEDSYISGQQDYRTSLSKLKTSDAKAVFIPGNYKESGLLLTQAKELGLNIPIIGGDGSYSPELMKIAGNSADGFYATLMSVNKDSDYYKNFHSLFVSKYNKEPDIYDAYAYEGGMIILEAIQKAGYDADKIKGYLYATTFKSMTGDLKFDKDGEVQRSYGVVQVKNGNFNEVKF